MPNLTQPQLQILLQLRRSQKPLTATQLSCTVRTLESLSALNYTELTTNPVTAKITTAGILATSDYIKNNPVLLPEKRSHLQEYEVFDLVSLYYPNESLYLLMTELRYANFKPINIGNDRMYTADKVRRMFDYLRYRECN